jgi:hypothetical protein
MRQEKTLEAMVENGGKMSPAMKKAGYSVAYSKHPEKLKRTKTWQQLLEEYLPDDLLARTANEGLHAITEKGAMDFNVRQRYLDTSLKMKNKLVEHHDLTSEGEKIGGFVVVKTVPASKEEDGKPVPVE